MVTLVIQIPCLNEEKTLPRVLEELPKSIPGISKIDVQIIDDGSTDNTVAVAKKYGVKRIIRHKKNQGLGTAFKHGMEAALAANADILVNTDADNQYPAKYIKDLVKPIIDGKADMVIGNRSPWKVKHFSPFKRVMQYFGNFVVRQIAGQDVPDTVSGFRAYSKEAMLRLNVTTQFSYVLDTIVQATHKGLVVASVPITTNSATRKSRLFKNIFEHMYKSGVNVLRCFIIYEPFRLFLILATCFFAPALMLSFRFLSQYFLGFGGGMIQSLIFAAILYTLGGLMLVLGIISMLVGVNRRLIEDHIYMKKKEMWG